MAGPLDRIPKQDIVDHGETMGTLSFSAHEDEDLTQEEVDRMHKAGQLYFAQARRSLRILKSLDSNERDIGEMAQLDVAWVVDKLTKDLKCSREEVPRNLVMLRFPQFAGNPEEITGRSDFKTSILPLLLAGEIAINHIPRIVWLRKRVEDYEAADDLRRPTKDIIRTEVTENAGVLRIDVKDYVKTHTALGEGDMIKQLDQFVFAVIVDKMRRYPEVELMEVAGDEAVFMSDNFGMLENFAKSLQRKFREDGVFPVEMGLARGDVYRTILPSGKFLMGGTAYEQAETIQKTLKKLQADDPEATSKGLYGWSAAGTYIYDDISGRDAEPPDVSTIRYDTIVDLSNSDLPKKLRRLVGLQAATSPESMSETETILYPETSVLFLTFNAPPLPEIKEDKSKTIQKAWAEQIEPIEEIVQKYGGTINYLSSGNDGVARMVIFFGAFKSSPLKQSTRAVECAGQLGAINHVRHSTIARGRMAQGPLGLSVTGLANVVNLAARVGIDMEKTNSKYGIAIDEKTLRVLEREELLDLLETMTEEGKEIRGIGTANILYCQNVTRRAIETTSIGYEEELTTLDEIMAQIKSNMGSNENIHSVLIENNPGFGSEDFFEDTCRQGAREGFTVIGTNPPLGWYRAYSFASSLIRDLFEDERQFTAWMNAIPEKKVSASEHPLWLAIFKESIKKKGNFSA
ncbi:MAG: hypothetical protein Q8P27_02855, partial [Candidatus Peregrinibacteria bacterium]|nr:hypothetical protein [Candidatus Peregrinibacteria bacterium]